MLPCSTFPYLLSVSSGGGGLPTAALTLTTGASATFGLNLGFALCDGVQVIPLSIRNLGGVGTAAYILDNGGGADASTMATRLLTCLQATFLAAGSSLVASAGGLSTEVIVTPGPSGVLAASRTLGIVVT